MNAKFDDTENTFYISLAKETELEDLAQEGVFAQLVNMKHEDLNTKIFLLPKVLDVYKGRFSNGLKVVPGEFGSLDELNEIKVLLDENGINKIASEEHNFELSVTGSHMRTYVIRGPGFKGERITTGNFFFE